VTPLTLTPLQDIPLIRHGDNLADILVKSLNETNIRLQDGDILVIAQKIVSKAEGRMVNLATVKPSQRALELAEQIQKDARVIELILQESNEVVRTRTGTIIVEHKLGFICANAGIDHSNVAGEGNPDEEWVLLLPEDPDASARELRHRLGAESGKKLGVLIIDSHGRAWRLGTVGVTVGLAGVPGLVDLRGKEDLFGYQLRITEVGIADELAAAASAVMGQADEATPVVHIRGLRYPLRNGSLGELLRPESQDLFCD